MSFSHKLRCLFSYSIKTWHPFLLRTRRLTGNPNEVSFLVTGGRSSESSSANHIKFSDLPLHPHVAASLKKFPFDVMTAVQRYAIPAVMDGNDVIMCSETGSGKTLAFVIPLLDSLLRSEPPELTKRKNRQLPLAVILSPSPQLSAQHNTLVTQMLDGSSYIADLMLMKMNSKHEVQVFTTNPDALMKHVLNKTVSLEACRYLVIDEADKFIRDDLTANLRKLLTSKFSGLPPPCSRRTVICGATLSTLAQEIYSPFLDPNFVKIVTDSRKHAPAPHSIRQTFLWTDSSFDSYGRLDILYQALNSIGGSEKVIVFCSSSFVKRLTSQLIAKGFRAVPLTRQLAPHQRTSSFRSFLEGNANVLVSSDMGSRGLDIPEVKYIINYQMPNTVESYVHRIGRSGRMGKEALAISIFGKENKDMADELITLLDSCGDVIPDFLLQKASMFKT